MRPNLNGVARVPSALDGATASTGFCVLRPEPTKIDGSYLFQWVKSSAFVSDMVSKATGASYPAVSDRIIFESSIPLPPLEEQRRIAAILDQAETLRAQRRQALAHLDTLTQSLFLDMFGDDVQGKPRFPVVALVDVLETPLQNGAYYPKEEYTVEGGVEMVHMSDAFNGIVHRGGLKRVNCSDADLKKYLLGEADILLARRSLTYEGAAKPCLIPPDTEPLLFESSFIRVTPDRTKLLVPYLFHYLGNETIRDKRVRPFITQSTISGINQSNLEQVPVVVPPLPLQQTFATRIQAIEALKATHRTALAQLDALFASLQQRAFSGELTRAAVPTRTKPDLSTLCTLEVKKMLEALIYVAKRMPGHDFYKSLKALYAGDRQHLEHHGCFIYGETYEALEHGPVPKAAYALTKQLEEATVSNLFADDPMSIPLQRTGNQLIPARDADFGVLSASERKSLDWAIKYFAPMSFGETKTATHDSAYLATAPNAPLAIEAIIRTLPEAAQRRFFG
ncbi:MAG: restriction endonuclease subunit S [Rhodoferax sp.]|nr:restriction endonuclease subunit S [Rhodoferax sp.]